LNIRDRGDFPWRRLELELGLCFIIVRRTDGVGRAGVGRALMLLGFAGPRREPRTREEWEARLGRLG
jgi:hypothetical protein